MTTGSDFEYGDAYSSWWLTLRGTSCWLPIPNGGDAVWNGAYVYDPVGDRLVSFGGGSGSFSTDWMTSLSLPSGTRTTLFPSGYVPAKRHSCQGVYDETRHRLVLFGGRGDVLHNDVAAYDLGPGAAWDSLTTAGTPPTPRYAHSAIYDALRDRMVVFGGTDDVQHFSEVWTFDFDTNTWTLANFGGPALSSAAAVYDPVGDRMVILGGVSASGPQNDTWALSLSDWTWSILPSPGAPSGGIHEAEAIYDPIGERMIVHGWDDDGDIMALSLSGTPMWTRLHAGTPVARWSHSAIYVPGSRRMVLFGGSTGIGTSDELNDVWAYDLNVPNWIGLSPAGTPPSPRAGHSAIYDEPNDRMIVFGGSGLGDLWELSLSGTPTWTALPQSGDVPSGRSGHTAIDDPVRQRMVLFGPYGDPSVYVLSLSGAPVWTKHTLPGAPDNAKAGVYDPLRDRLLVMTGSAVWALSLADPLTWTELPTAGSFPPSYAFTGARPVYDSIHDRVVMFNGGETHAYDTKTYSLDLSLPTPTWEELAPAGNLPPGRNSSVSIYDSFFDRLILHGGVHTTGLGYVTQFNQLYYLTFGEALSVPSPDVRAITNQVLAVRPNPGRATHAFEIELATAGAGGRIEVFAVTGQRVWSKTLGDFPAGRHWIEWNGQRSDGRLATAGVYLVRLTRAGQASTRRFVRIR